MPGSVSPSIAAVSTLFVMPALFVVLGHRVSGGRLPWAKANRGRTGTRAAMWGRLAGTVMRRPALTALPVLAVLLLAAGPLLGITFGTPDERVLPEDAESRQVSSVLREKFNGDDDAALHVVIGKPVNKAPLESYAVALSGLGGVVRVETSTGTYAAGRSTAAAPGNTALGRPDAQRINVVSALSPKSAQAQGLVREVRAVAPPAGPHPLVGGADAVLVDSKDSVGSRLPIAVALVAVISSTPSPYAASSSPPRCACSAARPGTRPASRESSTGGSASAKAGPRPSPQLRRGS